MRALIRVRNASPTSMFLPETRNGMINLRYALLTTRLLRDRITIAAPPDGSLAHQGHNPIKLNRDHGPPSCLGMMLFRKRVFGIMLWSRASRPPKAASRAVAAPTTGCAWLRD